MNKIEAIARVLSEEEYGQGGNAEYMGKPLWKNHIDTAKRILAAMLPITPEMDEAADNLEPRDGWWPDEPGDRNTAEQIYTAMIQREIDINV